MRTVTVQKGSLDFVQSRDKLSNDEYNRYIPHLHWSNQYAVSTGCKGEANNEALWIQIYFAHDRQTSTVS